MKKILSIVVKVLFIAGAGYGVFLVHQAESSWWLDIFLVIMAIQLLSNFFNFMSNAYLWKKLVTSLSSVSISFLISSVVYLFIKESWGWAAFAGLAAAVIINMVFAWNEVAAQVNLTQAQNLIKTNPREAIQNALKARELYMKGRVKPGQADAEAFLAQAYSAAQPVQAIRYANSALQIYRELNNRQQMNNMQQLLTGFKMRNFDIKSSAAEIAPEFALDFRVFLQGLLWIASWVAILLIWKFENFQASLLIWGVMGASFLILFYGFFFIRSFSEFSNKKNTFSYILFTLGWIVLNAAGLAFSMGRPKFKTVDFPAAFQAALDWFAEFAGDFPGWVVPAAAGLGLVLAVIGLARLSAGFKGGLSINLFSGNATQKKLEAVRELMLNSEWSQAIISLNQIDLTQKRNQSIRTEVLFNLSYAYYKVERLIEAKQFLKELLSIESTHKHALYLLGYIHLFENKLDEAEGVWRKLTTLDRQFAPGGNKKSELSACHYLCVTLYRKAAALVGRDDEAVSKLIAEVSQLGSLNQEMADVLIRINLNTYCQAVRQNDWTKAGSALEGIQKQIGHLQGLVRDEKDLKKLHGLTQAAEGLLAFSQNNYSQAIQQFEAAESETRSITQVKNRMFLDGNSPFEFLLRSVLEDKKDPDKVNSGFPRDLLFMLSISHLRQLHDNLPSSTTRQVKAEIKNIKEILEKITTKNSESIEARGLLGLIYYFFEINKEKQDFGMEMLQMVREGIGSRFINQVVNKYETEKQQNTELKKNYFSLLEQFLHSSTVSYDEREQIRKQILKQMRKDGQYDEFIGEGKFEMDSDRDREPTVKEYIDRMALLHEKMEQIRNMQSSDALSSEIQSLLDELNKHNENLKNQVQSITSVEQKLLLAAQKLL